MDLPFTIDQFLDVFKQYNESIFPAQIIAYIFGLECIILLFTKNKFKSVFILSTLSLFWLWNGIFYHILNFSAINKAAFGFGGLFVIQGIIFALLGFSKNKYTFEIDKSINSITGLVLIVYAMIIYPIIGMSLGHSYPNSPVFGVAPCPTTIFTFGILLQIKEKCKYWILIIPVIWSFIGFFAAIKLGITEDIGLLVSSILTVILMSVKKK